MLSRFDVHNVVAVLRAHAGAAKREGADALVRVGWMTGSLAREVLRQDGLAGAVDLLARSTPDRETGQPLRAAFAEYERTEDLAALERAVFADHAARLSASLASAGSAAGTLLRFVRREIDEHNLLVALRLRDAVASGAEADTPPEATRLPGGSVPPAAFADALNAPDRRRRRRVASGGWPRERGRRRWSDGWQAATSPRSSGSSSDAGIADAVALFVAGDPLAIDVPIAFMAAKQAEARNLRLLGEAACPRHRPGDRPARAALDEGSAHEPAARHDDAASWRAGYRLAGVTVFEVGSSAEAATQLEELLDQEDGVIAVHAPFFHAFARPLRRRLDALRAPLVVPLPGGQTDDEAERPQDTAASDAPPGGRLRDHVR